MRWKSFATYGNEIQLLLTDVIMPKMSGRELAERLKAKSLRGCERCRVFMSGYTDDIVAREGVLFANTILLHKPFTLEGLTRKLREVPGRLTGRLAPPLTECDGPCVSPDSFHAPYSLGARSGELLAEYWLRGSPT